MEIFAEVRFKTSKIKWTEKLFKRALDGLELTGVLVEGHAKRLCPVDTGRLRDSIDHKVEASDLSVTIGTPVEYAIFIEFGSGEFAENGKGRKGGWFYADDKGKGHFTFGNHPQPFLRPAIFEHKKEIAEILTKALRNKVKEI